MEAKFVPVESDRRKRKKKYVSKKIKDDYEFGQDFLIISQAYLCAYTKIVPKVLSTLILIDSDGSES